MLDGRGQHQAKLYAVGKLVLWHPQFIRGSTTITEMLSDSDRIAVAHPTLAPFGSAAHHYLNHQTVNTEGKRVVARNISQAFSWISSASADVGFISLSQVLEKGIAPQNYTLIPTEEYPSIEQALVVMVPNHLTELKVKTEHFITFIQSKRGQRILQESGYLTYNQKSHAADD